MNGLVIVDKPEGLTSADVVRDAKRLLRTKTGHLGTLDPFASGVLPLCVGEGTKIAQFLNEADKDYSGLIRLGDETETGDPTGTVSRSQPVPKFDDSRLRQIALQFVGEIQQVPPMYSAIKQAGTPLYKLARRGIEVERQPRRVTIHAFDLRAHDDRTLAFSVSCSKGTYIRVLAAEVAAALGTVGHLTSLRRTRFGRFTEEESVSLEALAAGHVAVIGLADALRDLRQVRLQPAEVSRARSGFLPVLETVPAGHPGEMLKLVDGDGDLVAVIECDDRSVWRYARVFS
jgi:tRNA pseudouridine55 synthase